MKILSASLLSLLLLSAAEAPVDYRFDEVKRKVTVTNASQALRVAKGEHAHDGDRVETGMFSYALIAAERYQAKFEIFGSTNVRLAGGAPGVILSIDRGRLHAIFDKITGTEPRVVATPGALLAVRGTQYTIDVDKGGRTTLDVFEGTVEVRSDLRPEPMLVHAGQESVFSRRDPPSAPMPMPRGRTPNGQRTPDNNRGDGRQPGNMPQSGQHGMNPPPQPHGGHH